LKDAPNSRAPGPSYSDVLKEFGLTPSLSGIWAGVGKTVQVQGWKLHLSSIPTEAVGLLSRTVPFLQQRGVSFKIANDASALSHLNEGDLGATQVGKFMTIYPRSDDEAVELADCMTRLTQGFHGPVIVSDLRLGDVVYTRYGGYNPIITCDRLGQMFLSIHSPDGTLRVDLQHVPFTPPDGVPNPFANFTTTPAVGEASVPARLFGPHYLVLEVVRHHPRGGIFRAIDLRSQTQVGLRIIKQGRQYCLADEHGRDIRTRLKRQEELHATLSGRAPIARADSYFEVDGDGYLPLEDVPGRSIESFAGNVLQDRSWEDLAVADQLTVLTYLEQLVSAVQAMHTAGYVHRDLTASNIWIGDDQRVYLLDLELAHRIDDPTPAFAKGTPGFMSPDQEAGEPPAYADDVYAVGCVMVLLLTGLDPRRVLFAGEKPRVRQLMELTSGGPRALIETIARCTSADPAARPDLASIQATTRRCIGELAGSVPEPADNRESPVSKNAPRPTADGGHERFIAGAAQGLLDCAMVDQVSGLWVSAVNPENRVGTGGFDLSRDAHKGVAGVVYMLGRLARCGYATDAARERVRQAVRWLLVDGSRIAHLPGLYFGEAGVAVALVEAAAGGLIERDAELDAFVSTALSGELNWPDITHGAAGQGVAVMYCAERCNEPAWLALSRRCARYLIESQKPDGSWDMPPGVGGMSGETLTGFAHGVAGIVYYLVEYERRVGSTEAAQAWNAGAAWLIDQAIPVNEGRVLDWLYSDAHQDRWKWWCHGSPGIALTFLALYEHTGNPLYADVARKALRTHPVGVRYANLSQCHGLSGLAEIYLEADRVLGDPEWAERAETIARLLMTLARENDRGSLSWLVENADAATADLMIGSSGVVHFLMRMARRDVPCGFPLLLDRYETASQDRPAREQQMKRGCWCVRTPPPERSP
jgi:class IV lanthipeptide synthase